MPTNLTRYAWLIQQLANHHSDECLNWPFAKTRGYGVFGGKEFGATVLVHRYAFFLTYGHWPHPVARHTCDNRACFNPRHIIEGTRLQNFEDLLEHGDSSKLFPKGELHPDAKLTEAEVASIRAEHGQLGYKKLARKYGVSRGSIRGIVSRKTWAHI